MAKKKAPFVQTVAQTKARAFVNKLAPVHEKISCCDAADLADALADAPVETVQINSRYDSMDFGGCYRCTLMAVLNLAVAGEIEPEENADGEE